ncbi:MAG: L,D-transpeptidase, partial [Gammaproteobacteria bacterium]
SSGYPQYRQAAGVPVFIFSPKTHTWAVYSSGGQLLKTGKASGGKNYCPDIHRACRTPSGIFHIIAKKGASCKSSKYPVGKGGAPMPYCTFFTKNHGIHGSYDVPNYNASHGCIRVHPADAKWIQSVLPIGAIVIVKPY